MKAPRTVPTDLELEILKVIWQRGQATVREVYNDLAAQRKIAYTTVLTMMGILEHKGHLKKERGERAYLYRPAQSEVQVKKRMVKEFVDRVFDGSTQPLLVQLIGERQISADEIHEIDELLKKQRQK
ncbi:MAG TPA: BlaI/MecI/CopY family transcriptional regulator [Bryobacteraceae bacterium]|nr:BlaI/MecI/CopY family transcriptional regulator [Bryobacteraceae bacterium]